MLKKLFALMLVVGLLGLTTGCPSKDKAKKSGATGNKTGGTGTGTGTGTGGKKTDEPKEAKLEFAAVDDVTIAPGKEAKVKMKVTRTNVDDDVTVKFSDLPAGVTADDVKIAKGKDEGEAVLKAAGDAKEKADNVVKFSAEGGKAKADGTFKVTVKK